jgi:hypothetical protein
MTSSCVKLEGVMMTETEKLVNKIVKEIDNLAEDSLHEVLDFVARLSNGEAMQGIKAGGAPEDDPIFKFIGGVSHGSLAHDIDRDLYGD